MHMDSLGIKQLNEGTHIVILPAKIIKQFFLEEKLHAIYKWDTPLKRLT